MGTSLATRFMVGLIVKPELPDIVSVDLSDDRDVNRYYYYICNGVDTVRTVSIDEDLVLAILGLVPGGLRERFPDLVDELMIEIKEDFTRNIKRAIVEFALADPFKERPSEVTPIKNIIILYFIFSYTSLIYFIKKIFSYTIHFYIVYVCVITYIYYTHFFIFSPVSL